MKNWVLLAIIISSFKLSASIDKCICQNNPMQCQVGILDCSGEISNEQSTSTFSEFKTFGPDDDFTPVASIRLRKHFQEQIVLDLGFYAISCNGIKGSLSVTFLIWKNLSPDYPVLSRESKEIELKLNERAYFAFKSNKNHVTGNCILKTPVLR